MKRKQQKKTPAKQPATALRSKKQVNFRHVSRDVLASIFNVTVRAVAHWSNAGCPRHADGTFDPAKVYQWRLDHAIEGGGLNLNAQKARLARAQAERAELDLQERRGELLERSSVQANVRGICAAARDRLLGIPERAAPIVVTLSTAAEVFAHFTTTVATALDSLQTREFIQDARSLAEQAAKEEQHK